MQVLRWLRLTSTTASMTSSQPSIGTAWRGGKNGHAPGAGGKAHLRSWCPKARPLQDEKRSFTKELSGFAARAPRASLHAPRFRASRRGYLAESGRSLERAGDANARGCRAHRPIDAASRAGSASGSSSHPTKEPASSAPPTEVAVTPIAFFPDWAARPLSPTPGQPGRIRRYGFSGQCGGRRRGSVGH
jgi:hypothetical protein